MPPLARRSFLAAIGLCVACGPNAGSTAAGRPSPTRGAAGATPAPPTPGATPQPAATPVPAAQATAGPPSISADVLVRGLDTPWAIDFAPDGRHFVSERSGRIRVVKDGQLVAE